jgi:non-specific serine/threonine protein kinase/serine/threonine-protein kinase
MAPFLTRLSWPLRTQDRRVEDEYGKDAPISPKKPLQQGIDPALHLHRRALQALQDLLDLCDADQKAWLADAASADPALATQVAALLHADQTAADALRTSPTAPANDDPSAIPDHVGPYRLVRRLGGGMGEVFLGERDDGLFAHTVAIKLIRQGRGYHQLSVHLSEERKMLASLQHSNIAQLFGGGTTPDGMPFIVMEYLPGKIITDHINDSGLGLIDRLKLFLTVCSAVQFAHQNLVVHADIKPSNIVVTQKAVVKLLDFGIARLMDPETGGSGAAKPLEPMTRAYAAPERLEGASPGISADIYSLGVLLYEILAGDLPRTRAQGRVIESAYEEAPPSWALEQRPPGPVRSKHLKGELDAIVMKALAFDPARRYPTVVEMSEDIERYLRGQPIKALPNTWQYQSKRFIGRHRLGLSLTAAIFLVTSLSAAGATALYFQSERDRASAVRRFAEARSMADYMVNDVDADLAHLPGTLPLRRRLVSRSQGYLQTLESDRLATPALRLEVARGYLHLAKIYGLDVSGGLGDLAAAHESLRHAASILTKLTADAPGDPQLLLANGEEKQIEGAEVFVSPEASTAAKSLQALKLSQNYFEKYIRTNPNDVDAKLALWQSQVMMVRILNYSSDDTRGIQIIEDTLKNSNIRVNTLQQIEKKHFILNGSYLLLAEAYRSRKNLLKSAYYYKIIISTIQNDRNNRRDYSPKDAYLSGTALGGLGEIYAKLGDYNKSIESFRAEISIYKHILSNCSRGWLLVA